MKYPSLLVSDEKGNIFDIPDFSMTGMTLDRTVVPDKEDMIPLPYGSNLFMLPGRTAVGYDPGAKKFIQLEKHEGKRIFAVAAFMAPAYLQFLTSSFVTQDAAVTLPLYSYTAAGWQNGEFVVAGARIDPDPRQDPVFVNEEVVKSQAELFLKKYPKNRLVSHLVHNCVFCYGCPAAKNFVLGRWECPVPTSPVCNAECLACISKQPEETGVKASQDRIAFVPKPEEIAEFTVDHLENAPGAVLSFGQGCEGEPLLVADVIEESIRLIRKKTSKGIINLNTNGSKPQAVEKLLKAGLDSIRVSLNSAQEQYYARYYSPKNYGFDDVMESLKLVRDYGKWSSINYFMFPGFTDQDTERAALASLIRTRKINMIQTRNLNMDPQWYRKSMDLDGKGEAAIGMRAWVEWMRKEFPWVKLGYFNPPKEEMKEGYYRFG